MVSTIFTQQSIGDGDRVVVVVDDDDDDNDDDDDDDDGNHLDELDELDDAQTMSCFTRGFTFDCHEV